MGFGFALVTLITAGIVKIPFRKYLLLNTIGQFVWTSLLLAIGYFLGNFYLYVNSALAKMGILALIVVIFIFLVGYGKFIKNKIEKKLQ